MRVACKISKPQDNPFWEKRNNGTRKKERKRTKRKNIINIGHNVMPAIPKVTHQYVNIDMHIYKIFQFQFQLINLNMNKLLENDDI